MSAFPVTWTLVKARLQLIDVYSPGLRVDGPLDEISDRAQDFDDVEGPFIETLPLPVAALATAGNQAPNFSTDSKGLWLGSQVV